MSTLIKNSNYTPILNDHQQKNNYQTHRIDGGIIYNPNQTE